MKRIFVICALLFSFTGMTAYALEAADMRFEQDTGGKYIYCNNREFINRADLADNSNESARFIMNNDSLTPDTYTLFASHVNHTDVRNEGGWKILEPGFDIELDVLFRAKEDTVIEITALGFEVPQNSKYYLNGGAYTKEEEWGCFSAWSSYLNLPISQLDSGVRYTPSPIEPVTVELCAGESMWLSKYIPNYTVVPYYRPVNLIADFKIISGCSDVNVAALRSTGELRDRSNFVKNAFSGPYIYEHQHKGISNTRNSVNTSLSFTIDDTTAAGAALPVRVYNQYAPNGNEVSSWYTNLSPRSDAWNQSKIPEDSLLAFEYKDDSKLRYYGSAVPDSEKDNIWRFDSKHSDIYEYPGYGTVYTKSTFIPNHELAPGESEAYAACLGNYGVLQNYRITISNEGLMTRYVKYMLNTNSNIVVILRDQYGNVVSPYPISKGYSELKERDTVACVRLPARSTTTFNITILLTTNYNGGIENKLELSDIPVPVRVYESTDSANVRDVSFTGREYVTWRNNTLYRSEDKLNWEEVELDSKTKAVFSGQNNTMRLYWTGSGYIAKSALYDGIPYYVVRDFYRTVYLLDENFLLKEEYTFDNYATEASGGKDRFYVNAGGLYFSEDFKEWTPIDSSLQTPVTALGNYSCSYRDGYVFLSVNGTYFAPVYSRSLHPDYVDSLGDIFYTISGSTVYVSKDATYWKAVDAGQPVNKIGRCYDQLLINDTVLLPIPELTEYAAVFYNAGHCELVIPPYEIDDMIYVPVRSLAELLGYELQWEEETETVTLKKTDTVIRINANSTQAYINGETAVLETPPVYTDGYITLSPDAIGTLFGYENVVWSPLYRRLVIE